MCTILSLGGELVRQEAAHNLLRLIAEGSGEDERQDAELRAYAAAELLNAMDDPNAPDVLVMVAAWVVGEYGQLTSLSSADLLDRLCSWCDRSLENNDTRVWIISAVTKVLARDLSQASRSSVQQLLEKYRRSVVLEVQQRCYELDQMLRHANHRALMLEA